MLRLTDIVLDFPGSDPSRVLMWGHSHGACITERAVEQGAPVHYDGIDHGTVVQSGLFGFRPRARGSTSRSS